MKIIPINTHRILPQVIGAKNTPVVNPEYPVGVNQFSNINENYRLSPKRAMGDNVSYYNTCFNKKLFMSTRRGYTRCLHPLTDDERFKLFSSNFIKEGLYIVEEIYAHDPSNVIGLDYFNQINYGSNDNAHREVIDVINSHCTRVAGRDYHSIFAGKSDVTIRMVYFISLETLLESERSHGVSYESYFDLLLYTDNIKDMISHPHYDNNIKKVEYVSPSQYDLSNSAGVHIVQIDNIGDKANSHYCNLGGSIIQINAVRNCPTMKDGFYVYTRNKRHTDNPASKDDEYLDVAYYTYEDVSNNNCPYPIFTTYHDACYLGDEKYRKRVQEEELRRKREEEEKRANEAKREEDRRANEAKREEERKMNEEKMKQEKRRFRMESLLTLGKLIVGSLLLPVVKHFVEGMLKKSAQT